MMFQLGFAVLTVAVMFYFLILTRRSAVRGLFIVAFFGTGVLFILYPELSTRLAHLVGIGRGADLVFYLSILFLFFLCFHFYVRFHALEDRLTRVARTVALEHPVTEEDGYRQ